MAPDITTTTTAITKTTSLSKAPSQPRRAYVTFLAGNGDYVKGVVGLAKGLRKAKSKYPLVVAILPDVPDEHRKILVDQGCIVREIEPVYPPESSTQFAMAYYVINYSKLRIWEFVEYTKMIYLDGDIQVFENIDHLFDMPDGYFYGVMDCFCEKTWSHTPQFKIGYCQQRPDKVQWPAELGPKPALYFSAGMFVYEPNISIYHDLLNTLKITPPTPFAEQDFLNMFFKDIYRPILPIYNLVLAMLWRHPENIELEKARAVRYCAAGSKPWRYTGKEQNMDREDIKMLIQKWWDIYNDESLDYKNYSTSASASEAEAGEDVSLQHFWEALSEAWRLFGRLVLSSTFTAITKITSLSEAPSQPRRAYVTFLAGKGDYLKGVVGLAKGLRKAKSKYPLVVAILPDVPEEHRKILVDQGCIVREIEPVYPPENSTQFAMGHYVINYSKLRIWEFVKYSKMIYLDGDIQVFENIDHLFDMPDGYFYGVMDCFCEKTWSHTPQFKIGYCQQCPDKVKWPAELGPKPALYFNAGMFVYEPSISIYHDLLNTLKITPPTPFAEQDFLNMFFKDIYRPIPPIYNLVLAMLWRHPENIELEKAKAVHYCAAGSKPWRYTGKEQNMDREDIKMLIQKWRDIYNDESLDYKNYSTSAAASEAEADEDVSLQPFWEAFSEAGAVRHFTAPSAA